MVQFKCKFLLRNLGRLANFMTLDIVFVPTPNPKAVCKMLLKMENSGWLGLSTKNKESEGSPCQPRLLFLFHAKHRIINSGHHTTM